MDFSNFIWDRDVNFLSPKKIYAYFLEGGIYKTMEVGNNGELVSKYAFVRLDNKVNYCIHTSSSLIELFEKHSKSPKENGHSQAQIFEFPSVRLFLQWCLTQELKY